MYEAFYQLKEKPFTILPDPSYIYWGESHTLAYSMLEYGVMNMSGFTVITGEIGCGKTTLIRHLLNQMDDDLTVGLLSNMVEEENDLLQWVLMAFDQEFQEDSYVVLFKQFQKFLIDQYAKNKRVILIVDEAQNLKTKTLEKLRLLSNINADKDQLIQLILVGQPQLKTLLQKPELMQFSQRISSDFHIKALELDDVKKYIAHRMKLVGCKKVIFPHKTCQKIFQASRGVPRLINIICDTALTYGFAEEAATISPALIQKVVKDKSKYGIFSYSDVSTMNPDQMYEISDGVEGPALVIHDRKLAQYLVKKMSI